MRRYGIAIAAVALMALMVTTGCRKPRKFVRTKSQQARVDKAILKAAPTPKYKVNANLDGKIKLIGLDIEPAKPNPGDKVTAHFYWECLETIGDEGDWMVFVHVEGPVQGGGVARVIADHHAVEDGPGGPGLYPMREWQKGQIIKDTKTFDLVDPKGRKLGPGQIVAYVGVFDMEAYRNKQRDIRMKITNPDETRHDGSNRIEAARFAVGNAPAAKARKPFKAPNLQVRTTLGKITVDGKLDEPSWRAALTSAAFRKTDGTPSLPAMHTRLKLLWDNEALYVGFIVRDKDIKSDFTERDQELWKQDVVELYLDPDKNGKNYVELQISPKNIIFDALFTERRKPEWKIASKWNLAGLVSAVNIGELPGSGKNTGWTVEARIPWAGLAAAQGKKPNAGDKWRANFFRVDAPADFNHLAAWSSVSDDRRPDFHNLQRAGTLTFVETPEAVKARMNKAPSPTAANTKQVNSAPEPKAKSADKPSQPEKKPAPSKAAPAPSK